MIECKCGRKFQNINGLHAHCFYCDEYVYSLDEESRNSILERRKFQKEKRDLRSKSTRDKWLNKYFKEPRYCLECGKVLEPPKQNQIFTYCSRSCASKAKYRNRSEESRLNALILSTEANRKRIEEKRRLESEEFARENHVCEQCGKILTSKFASGRFCSKLCSDKYCAEWHKDHLVEISKRLKKKWKDPDFRDKCISGQQQAIAEGRWSPMMRSCIPSGPERYWNKLLLDNDIRFCYNYLVKHADLGMIRPKLSWYKLDFYLIDYHVDLEIDGSEHLTEEHIKSDEIRDHNLVIGGYNVYRIPWITEKETTSQLEDLKVYLSSLTKVVNPLIEPCPISESNI